MIPLDGPEESVTEIEKLTSLLSDRDKENINKLRFEAVEGRVAVLERLSNRNYEAVISGNKDTAEVLEWVRNAKMGARIGSKLIAFLGKLVVLVGKYAAGAAVIYAIYETLRYGKAFHINLPPPE